MKVSVAVGNRRLLKLAVGVEKLPPSRFEYSEISTGIGLPTRPTETCGSAGCVMGWAPVFLGKTVVSRRLRRELLCGNFRGPAMELFCIDGLQACRLFAPFTSGLDHDATPKQVARHIRKFVAGRKP
jgi:hypothetical protein